MRIVNQLEVLVVTTGRWCVQLTQRMTMRRSRKNRRGQRRDRSYVQRWNCENRTRCRVPSR
jgi:hypothetical protein